MAKKDKSTILKRLRRRMETLERLGQDLHNPPAGRLRDTINNIAVQGRSVTNILQNLRRIAPNFDEWYGPYRKQMEQDELMRFFYQLRSKSLKEGEDEIRGVSVRPGMQGGVVLGPDGISYVIRNQDGSEEKVFYPKPPNAVSSFLGDSEGGGAGWIVENSDGSKSTVYIPIPKKAADISLRFSNPPQKIGNRSAENLCELYIAYLRELVKEAEELFGNKKPN